MSLLGLLISNLAVRGPVLIAAVAGIIVALTLRHRSPRAALLLAGACVLLLADQAVSLPVALLPAMRFTYHLSMSAIVTLSIVLGLISALLMAASVALFIVAAFVRRTAPAGAGAPPPPNP